MLVGPGSAWSGRVREGAEAGEDLGEQAVAGGSRRIKVPAWRTSRRSRFLPRILATR